MPLIVPIEEIKNYAGFSDIVHSCNEPVFITKNGEYDMVIMSTETYELFHQQNEMYRDIAISETEISRVKTLDAVFALNNRKKTTER